MPLNSRLVNIYQYREKKKADIKGFISKIEPGIHKKFLNFNSSHPLLRLKNLRVLPFERKLIIWAWNRINEFAEMDMIDLGVEIFYTLIEKHEEFGAFIKVNPVRIDTIRKVSDAFMVSMNMIMEVFYEEDKLQELYDTLLIIHLPLKIPWKYYDIFKDHLIEFMKNRMQKDWESDFTDMWVNFLRLLWVCISSGTLNNPNEPVPKKNDKKSKKIGNYEVALKRWFDEKMNTFCITEIACPEVDILRIQDFYNSHETTFSKEKNSLGIIVFRG